MLCPSALSGADNQPRARGLDDIVSNERKFVDPEDALDLDQETTQKPEVPAGNAGDGCDRSVIGEIGDVQLQAERSPVTGEDERQIVTLQWVIVMSEAYPAVELQIALQLSFQTGHPDQDDADTGPVEDIAHVLRAVS